MARMMCPLAPRKTCSPTCSDSCAPPPCVLIARVKVGHLTLHVLLPHLTLLFLQRLGARTLFVLACDPLLNVSPCTTCMRVASNSLRCKFLMINFGLPCCRTRSRLLDLFLQRAVDRFVSTFFASYRVFAHCSDIIHLLDLAVCAHCTFMQSSLHHSAPGRSRVP